MEPILGAPQPVQVCWWAQGWKCLLTSLSTVAQVEGHGRTVSALSPRKARA
jgi:hypothetical protein